MLAKVDASLPKSLGDLELRQGDAKKAKKKEPAADVKQEEPADETLSTAPVNIRYLGRKLDLLA